MDAAAGQRVIFASYFSKQNLFKTIYILVVPLLPTSKSSVDTSSGGLALREVPFFSFFFFTDESAQRFLQGFVLFIQQG